MDLGFEYELDDSVNWIVQKMDPINCLAKILAKIIQDEVVEVERQSTLGSA